MSNAWEFAANLGASASDKINSIHRRDDGNSSSTSSMLHHMNPFDIESDPYGNDADDLETALIEKQNWSPKELSLLQRITKSRIITEEELLAEEAQEREVKMESMSKDFVKVHEVFADLEEIVRSQDSNVQQVQDDVTAAHTRAEDGVSQIKKATKHQKRNFSCATIALSSFACIVILLAVVAILSTKYGAFFI
mmetsp:Transcript_8834/g.11248  ORF Transcript_8834/g.11248 Transcript_8834/m.11248 type:complete len:194 (-) Transcript_8834:459-1040(-)